MVICLFLTELNSLLDRTRSLKVTLKRGDCVKFTEEQIEKIVNDCFELVKQGKLTYVEFYKMSLKDMCKRLDRERADGKIK